MKRFLKIMVPVILSVAILFGIAWYLFSYDKGFTQDILLSCGRIFANSGNMKVASYFYDLAYDQNHNRNAVIIELAEKYIQNDNYTKAEAALYRAIEDGADAKVYIALSKIYVAQDKLYDAVELLNGITDMDVKDELEPLRPEPPYTTEDDGPFNQLIDYSIESSANKLYVNPDGEYPSIAKHLYTAPVTLKEGENILYAVAVSDLGLVSPLKIFKPTVNGVITEVIFQDSMIEQEIRKILNVSDDTILYSNDLWNITEFTVPQNAIKYEDIRHMIHLESLTIENGVSGQICRINNNLDSFQQTLKSLTIKNISLSSEDLDFIAELLNLENLTLEECSLSTSTHFTALTKLKSLNLNFNSIRNISALASMPDLTELYMHRNALDDLTVLSNCSQLEILDVSDNLLNTLSPIASLSKIYSLNFSNNQIEDISILKNMTALKVLDASNNAISDIAPLSVCTKLTTLKLSENSISSLDALSTLKSITYLDFSHNHVEALPQWHVDSAFVTIDGSYNQISDLTPLATLKQINNILMDYNPNIQTVECLATCPVLIQVNIYGTKVTDVSMLTAQSIIVNYNPLETASEATNN